MDFITNLGSALLWLFAGAVGLFVFLFVLSAICRVCTTAVVNSILQCIGERNNGEKKGTEKSK